MKSETLSIALIGCGNLGGAMLRGWLAKKIDAEYAVLKPHDMPAEFNARNITHVRTPAEAAPYLKNANIIVLAVKPQVMDEVTKSLAPFVPKDALILSIAAGRSITSFEAVFGAQQPVIRTIPNLGAQASESMTPAIANKNVTSAQHDLAEKLLKAIGEVDWLKDENLMHAAAAVTASGPGFLAGLMESLAKAAQHQGFDAPTSEKYARQMLIGAAAALKNNPSLTFAKLREQVSSPKGMTLAGLDVMKPCADELMDETIEAATNRSKELGKI